MSDLKERLRALRKAHQLTQEQLGKKVNLSRTAISNYEFGNCEPDINTLKSFASYFNVSIDYLVGYENKELVSISKDKITSLKGHSRQIIEILQNFPDTSQNTNKKS